MARLIVEQSDFTLTFTCAKWGAMRERARHNGLGAAQLYSCFAWTGEVGGIRIEPEAGEGFAPMTLSAGGRGPVERGEPFFFDNVSYDVWLEFAEACSEAAVGEAAEAVGAGAFTVHAEKGRGTILTGRIDFRNDIGKSDFRLSYVKGGFRREFRLTFHVLSTKLDYHSDWRRIVEDVENEYRMLSYDFLRRTYHSFRKDGAGRTDDLIWWQVFAKEREAFLKACRLILNRPRSRFRREEEYRRADQLKVLTPALENEFGEHRALPAHLYLATRGAQTKDTVENRFFKYAVGVISRKHDLLAERVREEAGRVREEEDAAGEREARLKALAGEVGATTNALRAIRTHPFFRGIGAFEGLRQVSLVLQRAPGYASMMRVFARLNALYDLQDGLYGLETKNIAELYELWCFIEVKNLVAEAIGVGPGQIRHTNRAEMGRWFGEDPKRGRQSRVIIGNPEGTVRLEVLYNAAARASGQSGIEETVAPTGGEQKPDIVLRLVRDYGAEAAFKLTYIFDAKYRLADEEGRDGVGAPPDDAINQMHRYRDAIYYGEGPLADADADIKKEVIGGYVLFPGTGEREEIERSGLYRSIERVNIGALPLRPGYAVGREFLREFIRGLIDKTTDEHLLGMASQNQKGTVRVKAGGLDADGFTAAARELGRKAHSAYFDAASINAFKEANAFFCNKGVGITDNPEKVETIFLFRVGADNVLKAILRVKYLNAFPSQAALSGAQYAGISCAKLARVKTGAPERGCWLWRIVQWVEVALRSPDKVNATIGGVNAIEH